MNDSFPETHHHHLLGSQRLSPVPCLWTSAVCGSCGTQGGQPPTIVPAGHRQRPARGERCWETEHALAALLLCHQCFHTHHQGVLMLEYSNCFVVTVAGTFAPTLLHCGNAKCWLRRVLFGVCSWSSTALSSLCSSPQSLTPTTSGTLWAIPQLGMRGSTALWSEQRTAPRQADPATHSTLNI